VDRISKQLYVGNLSDTSIDVLNENGITAVLSCVMPDELWFVRQGGTLERKHLVVPMSDGEVVSVAAIDIALDQLETWIEEGETVLVHCAAGISRSPSIIIAYLITLGMTWDDGLTLVEGVRPIVLPHRLLKQSVLRYFRVWPYDGAYEL